MHAKALPCEDLQQIAKVCEPELGRLKGQAIFLTGGTGFLGRWIVESLVYANKNLNLDINLTVLSRDPDNFLKRHPHLKNVKNLNFVGGSIAELPFLEEKFDIFIHGATDSEWATKSSQQVEDLIVDGSRQCLTFAEQHGCRKFLYLSSGAIYGKDAKEKQVFTESDKADPMLGYGSGKYQSELLGGSTKAMDFYIARLFSFLGPNMPLGLHFAAGDFIKKSLEGQQIELNGTGRDIRSYLYPADMVVWLLHILLHGEHNEAYNVGSDEVTSILDLAEKISDHTTQKEVKRAEQGKQASFGSYAPSIEKCKQKLRLQVLTDLDTAIQKTVSWFEKNK